MNKRRLKRKNIDPYIKVQRKAKKLFDYDISKIGRDSEVDSLDHALLILGQACFELSNLLSSGKHDIVRFLFEEADKGNLPIVSSVKYVLYNTPTVFNTMRDTFDIITDEI